MNKQSGFSLVEWMVVIVIGLFLTAGLGSFLVASKRTSESTYQNEQMLESGRIAMHLISRDLRMAGFLGEYTGKPMVDKAGVTVSDGSHLAADDDCIINWVGAGASNEGSFPSSQGRFSPLFVGRVSGSEDLGGQYACVGDLSNVVQNSDVIGIKRVIGQPLASADIQSSRYYLAANTAEAVFFAGDEAVPSLTAQQIWEYQHIVYYLANSETTGYPGLRQLHLAHDDGMIPATGAGTVNTPIVEGVEQIRVLLGIDSDPIQDGIINDYIAAEDVTAQHYAEGRILGAKLFVLVRSLTEDGSYTNNNTYNLGDSSFSAGGDHFRRILFEEVISMRNLALVAE